MSQQHSSINPSALSAEAYSDGTDVSNRLRAALSGLRFGQVVVLVEHGEIVRIERVNRQRCFSRRGGKSSGAPHGESK